MTTNDLTQDLADEVAARTGDDEALPLDLVAPPASLVGVWMILDPANTVVTGGNVETFRGYKGGADVTQSSAAQRALYTAKDAALNQRASARFAGNGTATRNFYPFDLSAFTQGEVFAVLKNDYGATSGMFPPTVNHTGLWQLNNAAASTHYPYTNGRVYDSFGHDARFDFDASALALQTPHIYNIRSASGAGAHVTTFNGAVMDTRGTWAMGFPAAARFGCTLDGLLAYNGLLGALVICNQVQTAPARAEMLSYLATRYGITL